MPVSGLVIVLDGRTDDHAATVEEIRRHGRFSLGTVDAPDRIPVVLETDDLDDDRRQIEWVRGLPGVALVEIAYFDFRQQE